MSLKFTPEMFEFTRGVDCITAASKAQKHFDEWLAAGTKIWLCKSADGYETKLFVEPIDATHTELLVCVEEIEKKECELRKENDKLKSDIALAVASLELYKDIPISIQIRGPSSQHGARYGVRCFDETWSAREALAKIRGDK